MIRHLAFRPVGSAVLAFTAAAAMAVIAAPAAHAVGENSSCRVNWTPNISATAGKNGWNFRTGPSTAFASRGYLYRGDKLTVLCSRGNWDYSKLAKRSKSGIPKGTKGWVRADGWLSLAS